MRAVFPVHLNGLCCDMVALAAIAKTHNLAVIEDACHALGGVQHDEKGQEFPLEPVNFLPLVVFHFTP